MLEARPSVGSHHDQVRGERSGLGLDLAPGHALAQAGVNHDRLVADRLDELCQLFLDLLVERRVRREQGGHVGHAFAGREDPGDHVQHRDLGSEPAAQGHRLPEGARGEVGEVGGAEDALDVQTVRSRLTSGVGVRLRPVVVASHEPDHVGAAHHPHEAPVLDDGDGVHAVA